MHDKNGTAISIGDRVTLECVVEQITTNEDYCNLTMRPVEPMAPSNRHDVVTVNTKQVVKVPTQETGAAKDATNEQNVASVTTAKDSDTAKAAAKPKQK